jgi:hypothetical protein
MRFRFSIRDILWLTLMAALAAGWFVDHRRLTTPPPAPTRVLAVTPATPVNRNPYNETATGYNAAGLPTFSGPRGGQYHYSADGGKVYDKHSKVTPVATSGIE